MDPNLLWLRRYLVARAAERAAVEAAAFGVVTLVGALVFHCVDVLTANPLRKILKRIVHGVEVDHSGPIHLVGRIGRAQP